MTPEPVGRAVVAAAGTLADLLTVALDPDRVVRPPAAVGSPWLGDGRAALDAFHAEVAGGGGHRQAVVCAWTDREWRGAAVDLTAADFERAIEWETACWSGALARAVGACADGGSVVLVTELPAALDVTGHLTTVVVGQGLANFARSLALGEGTRGVRVNVVATEVLTAPAEPLGVAPPLGDFPGRPEVEVAGAVRVLLAEDAAGITGTVVRADCGRTW